MKDQTKEKIVLLTLNDNTKVEGILIKIDKENLKIILEKGKITNAEGKLEVFEKTEIKKQDIKEIRLVEEKDKPKDQEIKQQSGPNEVSLSQQNNTNSNSNTTNTPLDISNNNKESDKTGSSKPSSSTAFSAIPLNIQEKYTNDNSKYDKKGFFDDLVIANNKENYKDVKTYNEKNKETFGLDDNYVDNEGKRGGRGYRKKGNRGNNNRGGRGGGNYRGGYGNNHNNNFYQNSGGYGGFYYHNNNNNYNNNNNNNNYGGNSQSSHFGVKSSEYSVYSNNTGFKSNTEDHSIYENK